MKTRLIVGGLAVVLPLLTAGGPSASEEGTAKQSPALRGYCPASYLLAGKAVKGDPAHQSVYAGQLYFLASAEAKKSFDADPEKYLPQYGGLCPTILGTERGDRIAGHPQIFEVFKGKVYLFSQERARNSFRAQGAEPVIVRADKRFNEPELSGYCPVSYQLRDRAVKGGPKYKVIHRTKVYHLSGPEARQAFLKDPEKYLPRYQGYCALGVASNKLLPGSPAAFSVVGGKTYLFWNAEAKKVFDANATELIKRADEIWGKINLKPKPTG